MTHHWFGVMNCHEPWPPFIASTGYRYYWRATSAHLQRPLQRLQVNLSLLWLGNIKKTASRMGLREISARYDGYSIYSDAFFAIDLARSQADTINRLKGNILSLSACIQKPGAFKPVAFFACLFACLLFAGRDYWLSAWGVAMRREYAWVMALLVYSFLLAIGVWLQLCSTSYISIIGFELLLLLLAIELRLASYLVPQLWQPHPNNGIVATSRLFTTGAVTGRWTSPCIPDFHSPIDYLSCPRSLSWLPFGVTWPISRILIGVLSLCPSVLVTLFPIAIPHLQTWQS